MIPILFLSIVVVTSIASLLISLFLFLKPVSAIEIQKKFYEKINWRMEPISMQKEIRNTKIMGMSLLVITILMITYVLIVGL